MNRVLQKTALVMWIACLFLAATISACNASAPPVPHPSPTTSTNPTGFEKPSPAPMPTATQAAGGALPIPPSNEPDPSPVTDPLGGQLPGESQPEPVEDMGVVIPNMISILESADAAEWASRVVDQGLVAASYGTTPPVTGITGSELDRTLETLVANTTPRVTGYTMPYSWLIDMVVAGLNPVEIPNSAGEIVRLSDPAYVTWIRTEAGSWKLWLLGDDPNGLLQRSVDKTAGGAELDKQTDPGRQDLEIIALIQDIENLLQSGDIQSLAPLIRREGLVILPFAVGAPEKGLSGDALTGALQAMLDGAAVQVIAYESATKGRFSLAVTGLNPVEVTPAVGTPLRLTSPALFTFLQAADGSWRLWALSLENGDLLTQTISRPPYKPWK